MSQLDPLADYITRINNSYKIGSRVVIVPKSKLLISLTNKLTRLNFFESYNVNDRTIELIISSNFGGLKQVSKQSQEVFAGKNNSFPQVVGSKGYNLVSTSLGEILTHMECITKSIGGKVLLQVFRA